METGVLRGNARFVTRVPRRITRHTLSFGEHYDPARLRIGPMVCHDDHLLASGTGFEAHRHADLEIVTWVVSGSLVHTDSLGDAGATGRVLGPGGAALLSAGAGVEHAEVAGADGPCRFVQAWLTPDEPGRPPAYAAAPAASPHGTTLLASGTPGEAPLTLGTAGARLRVLRLDRLEELVLADLAPTTHVLVVTGALTRSSLAEPLAAGDAFLLTGVAPGDSVALTAAVPTELLVWTFA